MSIYSKIVATFCAVLAFYAQPVLAQEAIPNSYHPQRFVVKFKQGHYTKAASKFKYSNLKRVKRLFKRLSLDDIYVVEIPEGADVKKACEVFETQYKNDIEYAHLDPAVKMTVIPNDTLYASHLWNMGKIMAGAAGQSAWNLNKGAGIIIGVVDSGLDSDHPDIAVNVWENLAEKNGTAGVDDDGNGYIDDVNGWDFGNWDNDPHDYDGHGSHVAGIAAAVGFNNEGVIGVAPEATIMPVKGFADDGGGFISDLVAAMEYAADNGAKVINNSWGCETACPSVPFLEDAIRDLHAQDVIVVFAAGNDNDDVVNWSPNQMTEPVIVAATDSTDAKVSFSNYGSTVDVAAPGVGITSLSANGGLNLIIAECELLSIPCAVGDDYMSINGTSMSAPHVAGLAALILSHHSSENYSNENVETIIKETVDSITPTNIGTGRINAYEALTLARLKPDINVGPPQSVEAGQTLQFNVNATDPNSDPLTLSATLSNGGPLPSGATFTDNGNNTGSFSWVTTEPQEGLDPVIRFKATDGLFYDDDLVAITVTAPPPPEPTSEDHWLEAELPNNNNGFQFANDSEASNNQFAYIPNGGGNSFNTPSSKALTFNVNITEAGSYYILARVKAPGGPDNSFWVQVNGVNNLWDVAISSSWIWDYVSHRGGANPFVANLNAGVNTIKITLREDGTMIDKLLITNDPSKIPSGLGEPAENLPTPEPTLNFSATPSSIEEGASSNLDWSASNVDTCTASDGWSGNKPLNGNEDVSPTATTTYTLECDGPLGSVSKDVTVTVTAPGAFEDHWLEAEAPDFNNGFVFVNDGNASFGQYAYVPNGGGNFYSSPSSKRITFNVNISSGGNYILAGRVLAASGPDDSFWVQIDNGVNHIWDVQRSSQWIWDNARSRNGADPIIFNLSPGNHTIKIKLREDGTKIDKLLLTNDVNRIPSGLGGAAENVGPPKPVITFSATPASILEGDNSTLSWSVTNATTCTALDGWSGPKSLDDSEVVSPLVTTTYTLECSGAGGMSSKSVTVTVSALGNGDIWKEAEAANIINSPFVVQSDPNASSGQFIVAPNGSGNHYSDVPGSKWINIPVNVTEPGVYVLWARVLAVAGPDDSFWVQMDNGSNSKWDVERSSTWIWDQVSHRGGADPVTYNLSAGAHNIKIKLREDGTKIDKLLLTNDLGLIPSGFGE